MFSKSLEIIALSVCLVAVVYPLITSRYYLNTNELGRAQMMMFIGESFVMFVTTMFAILSLINKLPEFNHDAQSLMRIVMSLTAVVTSYRVHRVLKKMISKNEGG